uniref:CRISPR-associated helicase, Cas3 family n=1 Tax=Candidatus Kentrum sp. TUN TaxID=2126343 RepID=A0A451A6A4_9GAMM|nr:MAG: CRISPR-associated helicase, Cas3 family [Candidatus Kentron sp. TUN]VFK61559.1 MAG: CRISPR-associated helicase, Cas3 family [Candidatus Kentron sp. TUN]
MIIAHVRDSDKKTQTLEEHLRNVSALSRANAKKIHLEECGELMGLLHDFGKYSEEFQKYIKSNTGTSDQQNQDEDEEIEDIHSTGKKGKIDHSSAGAQFIRNELGAADLRKRIIGQFLSLCLASHHSGLIDCLAADMKRFGEDIFTRRMEKSDTKTHLSEVLGKIDTELLDRAKALLSSPELLDSIFRHLEEIIDKAPENNDESTVVQQQFGLLTRFLFSCLIDADRVDTADFERPMAARQRPKSQYLDWGTLIDHLERHIAELSGNSKIDSIRREISNHCLDAAKRNRGIYTLTVPTGGGKTLASLRFALHHAKQHGMDRIIYIIPFTSIIDQNARTVREILASPDENTENRRNRTRIVLEHHSNLTPEVHGWREKMLSENWDAPVVFTTSVLFLETLFGSGTRSARRMHQLANAVLIFDEVQSLPVNCVHLFNNAMNFLVAQCGTTVLLCTATQPRLHKVDKKKGAIRLQADSELIPDKSRLFAKLKRVEVRNQRKSGGWANGEIADLAMAETRRAGSCLVIVNTKRSARALFQLCKGKEPDFPICHLSTSMCPAHRKVVLDSVREHLEPETKRPVLCISTQLIEAGIDVDFGAVIRFTAGLDSIAQAAGRCNRNGRNTKPGIVHVINPAKENLEKLSDIAIGRDKARRVFHDFRDHPEKYGNDLIGPETMEWYYENYFSARSREMVYRLSEKNGFGRNDDLLNLLSINEMAVEEYKNNNKKGPPIYLRQSFMTAARFFQVINAPTRGVIVPYSEKGNKLIAALCGAFEVEKQFELLRRAQQFTVNVFPHELKRLDDNNALHAVQPGTEIFYLMEENYYDPDFGLGMEIAEASHKMAFLGI